MLLQMKKSGTVHVEENAFEEYIYYIFKSMLATGFRNIYVVIHHQFEQESLMPYDTFVYESSKTGNNGIFRENKRTRLVGEREL